MQTINLKTQNNDDVYNCFMQSKNNLHIDDSAIYCDSFNSCATIATLNVDDDGDFYSITFNTTNKQQIANIKANLGNLI